MYQYDGIIKIRNGTGASIFIAQPKLKLYVSYMNWRLNLALTCSQNSSGKFYDAPDKDKEILPRDLDGTEIKDKEAFLVYVCGRDKEPAGTEGTIDLEDIDDERITTLYWDVPLGSSKNTFSVAGNRSKYIVAADGYNRTGTGLGTADVEVTKKPTTDG